MTMASEQHAIGNSEDWEYEAYLSRIHARFINNLLAGDRLFDTDAADLYESFLAMLPDDQRQYHNCNACRRFINTYGGLVTIDASGEKHSVLWDVSDTPSLYVNSVNAMLGRIRRSRVTGVFLSSEKMWGTPVTGVWKHFGFSAPKELVFTHAVYSDSQMRAQKLEDFNTLARAMADFDGDVLRTAVQLLESDSLYRSEKVLGAAKWLLSLHERMASVKNHLTRENILWVAVASAPAGFCHPRSSMIGTLLEDITADMSFDEVSRRFAAKMNPLQYQRPQAAPSVGNIDQAERLVEKLGIASALKRRFARLDDIVALWTPKKPVVDTGGGVFGHLKQQPKRTQSILAVPNKTMTWEKFRREVLPGATEMFFHVPPGATSFAALVTAEDPNAPPIIQWDTHAKRNPVSWYLYKGGSTANHWNLRAGAWQRISAVTLKPSMWYLDENSPKMDHQGKGVILVLEGAYDTRSKGTGLGLFPEILKSDLHGIRSTIEAHSRRGEISGVEEASACGIILTSGSTWNARVRVLWGGVESEYTLDRWD